MSLFITSLNSGSNGNCYYIGNAHEAVLIDAGISCKETEKRIQRLGLSMQKVKAIFITHEHIDHIKGVEVLANRHQLPVYITAATLHNSHARIHTHLVKPFRAYESIKIGGLAVTGFPKQHDAVEPHSFMITGNGVTVGVFTDIGASCEHVITNFRQCHAAFLEANYDEVMLEQGSYPIHLQRRIRGGNGHLSNRQALELFMAHRPAHMSHLLLSHLSKNNNNPELVTDLFSPFAKEMNIVIATRYKETAIYEVTDIRSKPKVIEKKKPERHASQPTLF